ncbi:glucose transporter type 3-like [Drosophila busckii]|uniref:glucose transporter type 3-like n=1 Tax=Drosophila busckii TaxID=30019 RepID=UPI00083EC80F|nr:glucose transporter type 3-like [Drosophila busckii]
MSSFWDRPGAQMQYVAAASAHLGVFSLGATIGWTAPAQQYITRGYYGFNVTLMNYGWICGMLQLGCCLVAVPAGYMATRWGCKSVMLLFVVPNLGAWALLIFAPNLELLMLSRFLLGVCGGSYLVTSTMYAAEIAQLEARRALGAFLELFMVLGILFAYGAGAFGQYKILNYACAALPIALIIAFAWLPASPVYYLRRSKIEKATSALIRLRSGQLNSSGELNRMQEELAEMRESQQFKSKRKPLLLIIGIMLFKNITGRQAIISYSTYVFESLHLKSTFPLDLYSIAMGLCLLLSALLTFPVVKWVKRRSLFIFSMFSLIFNAAFVGVYFHLREDRNERIGDSLSWISLACLYCLMFFMGLGCGNLPYLVMDELLAQPFKSVYHWIVFTCSSFFGFASILSFPASVVYCTIEGAFWFFMCCAFIAVFYLFCLVPETRPVEEGAEPAEPKPVLTVRRSKFNFRWKC